MVRRIFLLMIASLPGHAASVGAEPTPQNEPRAESYEIGRLFFSPDERAILDRMRQKSGGSTVSATDRITLNGIVRRSSGKTTAWINRLPQHENETSQGVVIQQEQTSKPSAVLLLPSGKKVNLKAGQTFDTGKGKIREGYEDAAAPPPQEAKK
jgi:hypothetical protein